MGNRLRGYRRVSRAVRPGCRFTEPVAGEQAPAKAQCCCEDHRGAAEADGNGVRRVLRSRSPRPLVLDAKHDGADDGHTEGAAELANGLDQTGRLAAFVAGDHPLV